MLEICLDDFKKLSGMALQNFSKSANHNQKLIAGISTDSRTIKTGEVFWVLSGDNFDGHDFVKKVQSKKPLFSVIASKQLSRFEKNDFALLAVPDTLKALQELAGLQRKKFNIPLLALTGSNGKTTTKEMIFTLLKSRLNVHKTEGNLNNHIGCPLTLLLLNQKHQAAIIEMGTNHSGEIETLAEITLPNQAMVTNVGAAHLEFFKNKETVAREKLSLFDKLPQNAIIYQNLDDPFIREYDLRGRQGVTYSLEQKADVQGKLLEVDAKGRGLFSLNGMTKVQLQAPGIHNVYNAVAAAAVGLQFGLTESEIRDALEAYASTKQRMQVVEKQGITFLNDAYNANPDSTSAALQALAKMKITGKFFIILGDMMELGSQSRQLHQQVVRQALQLNPAGVMVFGSEMQAAVADYLNVQVFESHQEIVQCLKEKAKAGDLVLLKGSRAMRMEQVLEQFN